MLTRITLLIPVLLIAAVTANGQETASKVLRVFKERCTSCHGKVNPQSGLNVLSRKALLNTRLSDDESLAVVPRDLTKSELWQRVTSGDDDSLMPPTDRLSAEDLGYIKLWIEDGADEFPVSTTKRPFVSTLDVYQAIEADLKKHLADEARDLRYFSVRHLHNNSEVSDADLRMFRAALSKLLNSLSWESSIVVPQSIDRHNTILRVNLADIGWDQNRLWRRLLQLYPYGLSHDSSRDAKLAASAAMVYQATGSRIPVVRTDWFVATSAVPPLYHDLLQLPSGHDADAKLEKKLNVDVQTDFLKNRLMRAGFIKSNVSDHNRLVDRHSSVYGAYWKSYDFASSSGKQSLIDAPLGPDFRGNEFARAAFEHDGGEIIFNLPNGLQAYLLIDGKGNRIDRGPINVVFDSKQPLGNKEVINGISCMVCHNRGMQPFKDDILAGTSVRGTAAQKVTRLYARSEEFDKVIEDDAQRFLRSLQRATTPFLKPGDDVVKREPVGAIARQFSDELFLVDVASEIGYENIKSLKLLFADSSYRVFGLGVVANDGPIKRDEWQHTGKGRAYSHFQLVSEKLGLGTPERVF